LVDIVVGWLIRIHRAFQVFNEGRHTALPDVMPRPDIHPPS